METEAAPTPEAAKKRKFFLALPTYADSMRRSFVLSLMDLLWINPIPDVEWTLGTIGGDGVARARNNLAQTFILTTDCEGMFCVDVDIRGWGRPQVERIINALSPERPIIGGMYAAKQMRHRWIYNPIAGEVADPKTGLLRVNETGTGFKAFHRRYFEDVMRAFPEIQYFCDGGQGQVVKWDFFSMGIVNGRYLSEDYYADYRARLIGIPVYVDTLCEVTHQGFMDFPFKDNVEVFDGVPVSVLFKLAKEFNDAPEAFRMRYGALTPESEAVRDGDGLLMLSR